MIYDICKALISSLPDNKSVYLNFESEFDDWKY